MSHPRDLNLHHHWCENLKSHSRTHSVVSFSPLRMQWLQLCCFLQVSRHERRASQLQALNEMPLYPTEDIIWNENIVPSEYFSGEGCLALPKLNLQFLTLHDYLLRNFNLFRLESTCTYPDTPCSLSRCHCLLLLVRDWKTNTDFWSFNFPGMTLYIYILFARGLKPRSLVLYIYIYRVIHDFGT